MLQKDGNWASDSAKTLNVIFETYFPKCRHTEAYTMKEINTHYGDHLHGLFTVNRVKWALNSFVAYKSSGPALE